MKLAMLDDGYYVVQFCFTCRRKQSRDAFPHVSSFKSDASHQMNEVVLKKKLLMVVG